MLWFLAAVADWWCPPTLVESHCDHWWDGEPCCRCGTDLGEKGDDS